MKQQRIVDDVTLGKSTAVEVVTSVNKKLKDLEEASVRQKFEEKAKIFNVKAVTKKV